MKLPASPCRGLCTHSCTSVPMNAAEVAALSAAAGRHFDAHPNGCYDRPFTITERHDERCPALTADGRCSGYEGRPMLCRLYGLTKAMRCPHGCEPERWLEDHESSALLGHPLPPEADGLLEHVVRAIERAKRR